jgi:hypothetical protein
MSRSSGTLWVDEEEEAVAFTDIPVRLQIGNSLVVVTNG